jgi:capsular polysaccharide export protein
MRYVIDWRDSGLWKRRALWRTFLNGEVDITWPGRRLPKDGVWLGWGRKRSGRRAIARAAEGGGRFLLLEDGFIRSLDLGVNGAPPLSVVADTTGIYYDATAPNDLETMLATSTFSKEELRDARRAIDLLRKEGLSKYNIGLPVPESLFSASSSGERVLVIDQTAGDLSLRYGLFDEKDGRHLLEAALEENPGAVIFIKTHPDVLAGRRRGMLPRMQDARLRWLVDDWHPHDLLAYFDKVYVATSLAGFDALILGKTVRCFGLPFYTGWGLTEDEKRSPRRGRRRKLEELVAAALLRYARYRDPRTGRACDFFTAAEVLAEEKRHFRFWAEQVQGPRWSRRVHAFGFQLWKRPQVRPFFGRGVRVVFSSNIAMARLKGLRKGDRIAVWGLRDPKGLRALEQELETRVVRIEDGFVRSAGLGSDFVPALSLIFDDLGIYFDPSAESRLERILNTARFSPEMLERAERLRQRIVREGITKYNLSPPGRPLWPGSEGRRVILVPGQVESDASILRGGGKIRTNAELLAAVRRDNPEAYIVYKPHPEIVSGNRLAGRRADVAAADFVELRTDIIGCIAHCDEVHTITSLSGFDALLRGRTVVTYGAPFYAGWGLTRDHVPLPRRRRRLTLPELIAGVLLLYPRYRLPGGETFAEIESVIEAILRDRETIRPPVRAWPLHQLRRAGQKLWLSGQALLK